MTIVATPPIALLAGVLVRVCRECGVPVEHLRAEQLIREAIEAWPGAESELWSAWLTEACRCLNLRVQDADVTAEEACRLAEDGAVVVGAWNEETGPAVLTRGNRDTAELAVGEIDQRAPVAPDALSGSDEGDRSVWLVVTAPEQVDATQHPRLASRPIARLVRLLRPEWHDIGLVLLFGLVAGVLSLATPIAVEALVNMVAFGRLLQPVVVLAVLLFGFLAFAGAMQALQTYVIEIIQRRLFARVSADLAYRLPQVDTYRLKGGYAPEYANRFFDVMTLQKFVAQLLLEGVNLVLATLVGMTVLAFYHPWLLGFDVLLLAIVVGGLFVLGRGAIRTGIDESKYKYRLAAWFEDLARCGNSFKQAGGAEFAADRANLLTTSYLGLRQSHFSVLFRQIVFVLSLQAVAGTVLLGGGGWLVIQGQLSLGQLVAAELIVSMILGSLAKTGKHLESFYDAVAAIDKLGVLFDLPVERHDGVLTLAANDKGAPVAVKSVTVRGARGKLAEGLSLEIGPGEQVALLGPSKSGKTSLCQALYGLRPMDHGRVSVAGVDPRDARPDVLRGSVALAGDPEFFEGTLADNVHLRRRGVGTRECRDALDAVGVLDDCFDLPDGLDTKLTASAFPLTGGQQRLVTLARALAGNPKLLVVDCLLDGLSDEQLHQAFEALLEGRWKGTLVVATGRRSVAERLNRVVELSE